MVLAKWVRLVKQLRSHEAAEGVSRRAAQRGVRSGRLDNGFPDESGSATFGRDVFARHGLFRGLGEWPGVGGRARVVWMTLGS